VVGTSGKGRGGWSVVWVSEQGLAFLFGPTSLKRGEGLLSGLVEAEIGSKHEDGGSRMAGKTNKTQP
jgi:hypothetical protein